jgi:multiple antibiotic resistance protein
MAQAYVVVRVDRMGFDLAFSIKVFSALFAIMNPIANVPVFLSLTSGASDAERRKIAVTALIAVSIGCVVAAVAGSSILGVFGVTIDDFRLAGGLLVLLIALSMLHGTANTQQAPTDRESKDLADADSVAIYPLAIPLLLGPGSIATMIVLGHSAASSGKELAFALGLTAFLLLLAVSMLAAPFIGHYLSPRVTAIAQRLMGMILAAIAVDMMMTSLRASFPGLT